MVKYVDLATRCCGSNLGRWGIDRNSPCPVLPKTGDWVGSPIRLSERHGDSAAPRQVTWSGIKRARPAETPGKTGVSDSLEQPEIGQPGVRRRRFLCECAQGPWCSCSRSRAVRSVRTRGQRGRGEECYVTHGAPGVSACRADASGVCARVRFRLAWTRSGQAGPVCRRSAQTLSHVDALGSGPVSSADARGLVCGRSGRVHPVQTPGRTRARVLGSNSSADAMPAHLEARVPTPSRSER